MCWDVKITYEGIHVTYEIIKGKRGELPGFYGNLGNTSTQMAFNNIILLMEAHHARFPESKQTLIFDERA